MVLVAAALYSWATHYKTASGETAAEVFHRKVDSVVNSVPPVPSKDKGRKKRSLKQLSRKQESDSASFRVLIMEPNSEVRQEWIDAVFGTQFCQKGESPNQQLRQGFGLAKLPEPYFSYSVRIPSVSSSDEKKLGITVSRLPLGLQVFKVQPNSEAALLRVQEGSILIDINGLCLLAEPTKHALERIWQYEGYLENEASSKALTVDCEEPKSPTSNEADDTTRMLKEPVAMTFIKNGKLYKVLFLSSPPWGISWASCGNFPLVKRVYSFAALAGIQRGSIVASVQNETFRDHDHAGLAHVLRNSFVNKDDIHLTLCFPPAAARSGRYNQKMGFPEDKARNETAQPKARRTKRTDDGIEIKFHSLESAIGGLCRNSALEVHDENRKRISQLAEEVASGHAEFPQMERRSSQVWTNAKTYSSCPKLSKDQLLAAWDPLQALLFCLQFHHAAYRIEDFNEFLLTSSASPLRSPVDSCKDLLSGERSPDVAGAFLLQVLSVICSPSNYHESDEEKKDEIVATVEAKQDAKELTSLLLNISQRDDGFCQTLYFLLRSYISSMETRRPTNVKGHDGPSSLIAQLNCLELLRFAEKQLSGQIHKLNIPSITSLVPPLSSQNGRTPNTHKQGKLFPSPVPSTKSALSIENSSPKKKGLIQFLRKKNGGSRIKSTSEERTTSRSELSESPEKKGKRSLVRSLSSPSESVEDRQLRNTGTRSTETRATQSKSDYPEEDDLTLSHSPSAMYENMSEFLSRLDVICGTIERTLQRSFRQKISDWARQPWSASKDSAVASVTAAMRQSLGQASVESRGRLLVNPVQSSELLASVDTEECYILPSAHFPILLTFNVSERQSGDDSAWEERLFRISVELVELQGLESPKNSSHVVHAAVAGTVIASEASQVDGMKHVWLTAQKLVFDTRSSWGAPQTLSIRLSPSPSGQGEESDEPPRFGWVDLSQLWEAQQEQGEENGQFTLRTKLTMFESKNAFDDHGDFSEVANGSLNLELNVRVEHIDFVDQSLGKFSRKRMLLYKHDEDLRQEGFAVQFIRTCDNILRAAGLDMKILTFKCIPVGTKRGFVEWVPGSVPLSEICQPFFDSLLENGFIPDTAHNSPSMVARAGLTKYESLSRVGSANGDSLRLLTGSSHGNSGPRVWNPVQDYLRSVAYDGESPYLVRRSVMDTYIKSCAGYGVITYILGVGDRHLDNLLLHQSGSFFHCDYSFILGSDPKTFQPMRITEQMVQGMGGKDSDNYAKFLSLASAAFLTLRRPENVRILLSLVRLMEFSSIPDITENQSIDHSITGMRDRLKLDLSADQAVVFMEDLIERSLSSKIWLAVDAIHSLGKKF